jgi:hypothetical protein
MILLFFFVLKLCERKNVGSSGSTFKAKELQDIVRISTRNKAIIEFCACTEYEVWFIHLSWNELQEV